MDNTSLLLIPLHKLYICKITYTSFSLVYPLTIQTKNDLINRSMPRYLAPILAINWLPWGYELLSINQWKGVSGIGKF